MKKTGALMRAFTILGLILVMAIIASPALAASGNPPTIKNMKVSVQPEYDDPRVMVTYEGEFKDASVFPQPVKFPAPLGSEMSMVCALKPPNNDHLCQLYDTLTEQNGLAISYTLPIPTYYLEYYWDGIKTQTDSKSFSFNYVSPYAVDTLEIEVQQPLRATNFKLVQPYASASSDALGMKYYRYVFSNVTPGQTISVDASYTKPDNKPSVAKKASSSTGTGTSSQGNPGSGLGNNLLIIGGVGLVTVIAGFLLFKRKPETAPVRTSMSRRAARIEARRADVQQHVESQRTQRPPSPRISRPAQTRGAIAGKTDQVSTEAVFCSKCGTKLASGATFCHVCGARAVGAG